MSDVNRIADLDFSDLYLEPDGSAWAKRSNDGKDRTVLDGALLEESVILRERLNEHRTGMDFTITLGDTQGDNVRLRIQRIEAIDGDVFVCRKLLSKIADIEKIGYSAKLINYLMSESLNKGLVLYTGSTGAGKSTSMSAFITARLRKHGGTCLTVENPIEISLSGRFYNSETGTVGTCYQTEVANENEIGDSIRRFKRASPTMIMVGEIRKQSTAAETVDAGGSGVLCCSTFHSNDIISALNRLRDMLSQSESQAMAESLAAIIHQSIEVRVINGQRKRVFSVSPLIISGTNNGTKIRQVLRQGDYQLLTSEIERQKTILFSNNGDDRYMI